MGPRALSATPRPSRGCYGYACSTAPVAASAALGAGLIGWYPLLLAAGEAQGDAPSTHRIAVTLALAGAASFVSVSAAIVGLAKAASASTRLTTLSSVLGLLLGAALGLVALVFALSFHW
jgi:hypothetical protein